MRSWERYSIVEFLCSDAWTPGPVLNHRRGSHSCVAVAPDIPFQAEAPATTVLVLAGGGAAREANLAEIEVLQRSPSDDDDDDDDDAPWKWTVGVAPAWPPLLRPRHAQGAAVLANKLYVVGGQGVSEVAASSPSAPTTSVYGTFGDMEVLDLATRVWARARPCSVARRLHGCAAAGGSLYVFGGAVGGPPWFTASAERYDPAADAWTPVAPLPHAGACWAVQLPPPPPPGASDAASPAIAVLLEGHGVFVYDVRQDTYTRRAALPVTGWASFACCVDGPAGVVYAVGGACGGQWLRCVWALDLASFTWAELPPMRHVRRRPAVVALPDGVRLI